VAISCTSAMADLLIYEPFDYTSGAAVIGQTDPYAINSPTWARAGTAATTVHQISSGSLIAPTGFPGGFGNSGDMKGVDFNEYNRLNLPLEYGASATIYYSLLLNVPTTNGLTTAHSNANANNDGLVALNNSTGTGTKPNTWAGELSIRIGGSAGTGGAGTFNLGIRASTTAASTTFWSADLAPGQTYLVVASFTQGATPGTGGSSPLWINPTSFGGSAPAADGSTAGTYSTSATSDHTDSLIIGAGIAAGAAPNDTTLDEIRVGTTWASVTTVPEPSTLALAGLGLAGVVAWHRRRQR